MVQCLCEVWFKCYLMLEVVSYYVYLFEWLVNYIYVYCNGNGMYESGDGWCYWGRGLIQIIGCVNYDRCGCVLLLFLLDQFDLFMDLCYGVCFVVWYWVDCGCFLVVDSCDYEELCKCINGGKYGFVDRVVWYENVKKVLV